MLERPNGNRWRRSSGALKWVVPGILLFVSCHPAWVHHPGELSTSAALGMPFRYVPAGTFQMGSPADEARRDDDEVRREVTLTRGFWLGEHEVTQGEWRRLMGTSPSFLAACGDDCPVERVSWFDAVAFAEQASRAEGLEGCYELVDCSGEPGGGCAPGEDWCHGEFACREVRFRGLDCHGYRLPTESEWERAARAGSDEATWIGSFEIVALNSAPGLSEIAWYGGNSGVDYRPAWPCSDWKGRQEPALECGTHPVAHKAPNPWGLQDVFGNVWEWTWDWHAVPDATPRTDPLGAASGEWKIRRGCSWSNIPDHCRAADRSNDPPADRDRNWGLRLARTAS